MDAAQKLFYTCLIITCLSLHGRSIHRPKNSLIPTVSVTWEKDHKVRTSSSSHWGPTLFHIYNKKKFRKRMLSEPYITYRNDPTKTIEKVTIQDMLEKLLSEIHKKKRKFTHFTVLQNKDFNCKRGGLLILKFKEHPFVLKLFIETPSSFIDPWGKGREQIFFFYLSGCNRHLNGLTRIANLETINKKIAKNKLWSNRITTPRKWYLLPKDPKWLNITGYNIGGVKKQSVKIPGTYAIVADYIEHTHSFSLSNQEHRQEALALCSDLDMLIDAHINNFLFEKGTNKVAIIDTEHFPIAVGYKEKKKYSSYIDWYLDLSYNCAKNLYFRTKDERIKAQTFVSEYMKEELL